MAAAALLVQAAAQVLMWHETLGDEVPHGWLRRADSERRAKNFQKREVTAA